MKLFQKTYQLVGIALLLSGGIFLAKDKELQLISSAYREVFAKEDLFAEENKKTHIWKRMINKLKGYVSYNAGGNKKLVKAYNLCDNVSDDLTRTLIEVYNSFFAAESPLKKAMTKARSDVETLTSRKIELTKMSNILKNTQFYFGAQKKNNVKDVLLRLISVLEVIINQLKGDFDKGYWKIVDRPWAL